MTRRDVLISAFALGASNSLPLRAQPKLAGHPFTLGVASGEPLPDGIVLWTRLAPKPVDGGGMPNLNVEVKWTIAEDEAFSKVAKRGVAVAAPSLGHSVHVEAGGLRPERWYWYRFEAAGEQSAAGRFRTAPARGETPARLRLAFASCQQWTQGLWTAYRHMAAEDLDLVVHLGDYIYEQGYRGTVRPEGMAETFTLTDYRNRHALYKTDPLLQAAHARFPWVVTWDDHEVSNNYAADVQEKGQPRAEFLERRASAYLAFYEHMPLRRAAMPKGSSMVLHRRYDFGDLMRLYMLDTRQYRSDQACGDGSKAACAEIEDSSRTLLGAAQETWLDKELSGSKARWNVLGQQILVTLQDFDPGPADLLNMDSWSGYPPARKRLVESLRASKARNPVILTGDVHASWGRGGAHGAARYVVAVRGGGVRGHFDLVGRRWRGHHRAGRAHEVRESADPLLQRPARLCAVRDDGRELAHGLPAAGVRCEAGVACGHASVVCAGGGKLDAAVGVTRLIVLESQLIAGHGSLHTYGSATLAARTARQ